MKKTLHLIDHANLGGAQSTVKGIVENLDNHQILPLRLKRTETRQISFEPCKCFSRPAENNWQYILNFLRLPILVKKHKIEVVHCQLMSAWLHGLWISLFFPKHKPVIIFHEQNSIRADAPFYRTLIKLAYKQGKLIAVSKAVQDTMVSFGVPREEIEIFYNFVDLKDFYQKDVDTETRKKLGMDEKWIAGRKVIGSAIRLVPYKGWETILKTAEEMRDDAVCFLIAGNGEDRKLVEDEIRKKQLEDKVCLLGMVTDMPAFYNCLDVFLFPSVKESFGIVLIEAQACGLPSIVMDIPIMHEVANKNSALIIDPENITEISHSIRKLINNVKYWQEMRIQSIENANRYRFDNYLKELISYYKNLQ